MAQKTPAQQARQHARSDGRYRPMNRCERCYRKRLGDYSYCSDDRLCNDGVGLVLCEPCSAIIAAMPVEDAIAALSK